MADGGRHDSPQQSAKKSEDWARGPRSLYIKRCDHGFGFTLRHFIVYPPESYTIFPGDPSGSPVAQAMDTIFVKHVHEHSPASKAGLATGDRIVSVNGENITGHSYAQVVQLIQQSSAPYLHLVVVPREHDILQLYFGATAHNPETNQRPTSRLKSPSASGAMQKASALPARVHHSNSAQQKHKSVKHRQSLDNSASPSSQTPRSHPSLDRPRQSLDNIRQPPDRQQQSLDNARQQSLDSPPWPQQAGPIGSENVGTTARYRTPNSRRASEGNNVKRDAIYGHNRYTDNELWGRLSSVGDKEMVMSRAMHGPLLTPSGSDTSGSSSSLHGPGGYSSGSGSSRRESNSSLPSRDNLTDSKDSLSSLDSTSTLTGLDHSSDDSLIMSRIRKSFEQKEEFLRRPTTPILYPASAANDPAAPLPPIIAREFYARPQKMKPVWPPNAASPHERSSSPGRAIPVAKPAHHNFRRVKSDIDSERDSMRASEGNGGDDGLQFVCGGAVTNVPNQDGRASRSQQRSFITTLSRIHENRTADLTNGDGETVSLPSSPNEDMYSRSSESPIDEVNRYNHHGPLIQLVSRRARQFESGHHADEQRTLLYKSELSRLSSKKSVPNVALRKQEIEARSGTTGERRDNRESHSMEKTTTAEVYHGMSGNRTTMIGTKNIHCEPPSDFHPVTDAPLSNDPVCRRARSNSAESWAAAFGSPRAISGTRNTLEWPLHGGGVSNEDDEPSRHKAVRQDSYLAAVRAPVHSENRSSRHLKRQGTSLDDFASDTPTTPPTRPTQLSLPVPTTTPSILVEDSAALTHTDTDALIKALDEAAAEGPKSSVNNVNNVLTTTVVRRQKNQQHTPTEDDRLRRSSYLKATNSDRMHVDSDHDYSDTELQTRSANRKWRPPLFPDDIQQLREFFEVGGVAPPLLRRPITSRPGEWVVPSLEQDKENQEQPSTKEGWLHCKFIVVDGKRASDRSWKPVWAVLSDHTLSLYKERPCAAQSQALGGDGNEPQSVDVARCQTDAAGGGYTKKKHALRLNTLSCSELLLQADDALDAQSWLAALQEQAAIQDQEENQKADATGNGANRLSPQSGKGIRKLTSFRNRSPTGQSPVSKTLKPSQTESLSSPKTKTWKGRVARQFRRIQHGAGSPSSPTAPHPEGSTIGILLEDCPPSEINEFVPFLVVKCATIVEERGLDIIGIYRVPGNTAAVSSLTEAVNKGFQFVTYQDPRWHDVNVISSLLKLFFRRLPDALLTSELYPLFIETDKMEDPNKRITTMRKLVHELPDHHFETLKFLCMHLKKVIEHSSVNKMEARNLAIVFGPTLIRTADNNMVTMVTDMSHQCRIVESLLLYTDWFFSDEDLDNAGSFPFPQFQQDTAANELEASAINHNLLLSNIQKVEGMKSESSGKDILAKVIGSSIISAANRKMQKAKSRKGVTHGGAVVATTAQCGDEAAREAGAADGDSRKRKEMRVQEVSADSDVTSPPPTSLVASSILESVMLSGNIVQTMRVEGDEECTPPDGPRPQAAGTVAESPTAFEDGTIRTYAGLSATTQERIRKFELETKAMLQRDLTWQRRDTDETTPRHNVESDPQPARRDLDRDGNQSDAATQPDSAATYSRTTATRTTFEHSSHSSSSTVSRLDHQSPSRKHADSAEPTSQPAVHRTSVTRLPAKVTANIHVNPIDRVDTTRAGNTRDSNANTSGLDAGDTRPSKKHQHVDSASSCDNRREVFRHGSSAENIAVLGEDDQATAGPQAAVNGTLKRFKTGKEQMGHPSLLVSSLQCSSLDSLQEALGADRPPSDLSDDGGDLLSSLTSTFDRKLKSLLSSTAPTREEPTNDKTPLVQHDEGVLEAAEVAEEAVEDGGGLLTPTYRDPSLHRGNSGGVLPAQDSPPAPKEDRELIRRRWLEDDDPSTQPPVTAIPSIEQPVEPVATLDDESVEVKPLGFKDSEARSEEVLTVNENRLSMPNSNNVVLRREPTSNARRPESLKIGNKENSKLKRSESLTKADKVDAAAANTKLKRSESLTRAEDKQNAKLKRSDSLTKTEKTESNISKRRQSELVSNRCRKEKENVVATTKLKRKNGMPERSIKRRHTVGGTKDFDKVNWLDNRLQQEQLDEVAMNEWAAKERRCLRTSSPDLSSSRLNSLRNREGFLVEIHSRQQAARPQSLVDGNVAPRSFKLGLPLESHV